jgi:flavin-dependent dehydrogenase
MSRDYDVVVVGARVAGASTALLLARAGLRVGLVDRSRYASDTVSTHALMRAGVMQLSRWGLLGQVVSAGTPAIRSAQFHYGDENIIRVPISPHAGVDALYAPRRYLLDRLLVDAAEDAGAHVLHQTTVTTLRRDTKGRIHGVSAVTRDGRAMHLPARMTVGADGIRSTIAALVGAPVLRRGQHASAILYRYLTGLHAESYEWAYGRGAAAGLIPTNNDQTCVFVSTTPTRMRALRRDGTQHAFTTLLARAAPTLVDRVAPGSRASRVHGWGGAPGHVRQSWGPGWALVGDAGYFKDPITTHGITNALRDAELLSAQILQSLSGRLPETIARWRYEETRDRLSHELFTATEDVASYDWDTDVLPSLLHRVSAAMNHEVDYLQAMPDPRVDAA